MLIQPMQIYLRLQIRNIQDGRFGEIFEERILDKLSHNKSLKKYIKINNLV
jgi:hypothetical protein